MRILQITPSLYNGGGEIFAFQLSDALARRGHEVKLFSLAEPSADSVLAPRLKTAPFEFSAVRRLNGSGLDLSIPSKIHAEVKSWKPDVVNTHLRSLFYSGFAIQHKCKKFHTVHNMADKECSKTIRVLYRTLFRMNWQPIAISDIVGQSIKNVYGLDAPKIDNGIFVPDNTLVGAENFRNQLGIDSSEKLITNIGRLTSQKNQVGLLKAFASLAKEDSNLHLALVGSDPLANQPYRELIDAYISNLRPTIAKNIHLLGVRRDVGDILSASDVFVLSSHYEGLPLTLLEALSLGVNCVCTRAGGIPDAINESNGWLVDVNSHAALVNGLRSALTEKSKKRSDSARRTFEARFSMDQCAAAYEELYRLSTR